MSAPTEPDLVRAAALLGAALRALDWRLATAESSTGGLIGHVITMTPGASDYYAGGVICYSNRAKELGSATRTAPRSSSWGCRTS